MGIELEGLEGAAFEDAEGEGFQPTRLNLLAAGTSGDSAGGEHVATVEATALLIYNTLVALFFATGPGPLTISPAVQAMIGPAVLAAIAAQAAQAPVGEVAQIAASTAFATAFPIGTTPMPCSVALNAAIAAVTLKTPNASGLFPSIGSAAVRTG